ncbi:hypothetical protein [Natrinema hispanicum]|uniref:hypothetical protein n=1 Tax=Natrinema hispanicum TaxID=392421 RepID=UPI00102C053C|nr:hypothetical protein [Natrinema hispanicum]
MQDKDSQQFKTVEDKAREALTHDDPVKSCAVTVRAHNRHYDADKGVTHHLIRTEEEWMAIRTWAEDGGDTGIAVNSHGETLTLDVLELNQDCVADRICNEGLDAIDSHDAVARPVEPFTALVRHAEDIAEILVTEWETGADHVVRERLYEGMAGWIGRTAWTAYEEEAMYIEAERATTQFIENHVRCEVSDDVEATIQDISKTALYDAVAEHRGRQTPHLDYAAEVTLTD